VIRGPDLTGSAALRFDCDVFVKVSHPDYLAHEVLELVRQRQVDMDPVAPGQVGTLILNGIPYTVLGYYTFVERDAECLEGPKDCSFRGPFYDFYQDEPATLAGLVAACGEDFEKARQAGRELREKMEQTRARRQPGRQPRGARAASAERR
jgi:hypothetical protein